MINRVDRAVFFAARRGAPAPYPSRSQTRFAHSFARDATSRSTTFGLTYVVISQIIHSG